MSSLVTKLLLLFLVWYASICLTSSVPDEYSISSLDLDKFTFHKEVFHLFQMWKNETQRQYQTLEEEAARFQISKSNLKLINERNAERKLPNDYSLGLNQFSDMSYGEFSKIYLHETEEPIMQSNSNKTIMNDGSSPNAPSSWDWRTQGAVTHVKKQGGCGSCCSFSATRAIEGINKIVTQRLPILSEQQLVSCVTRSSGCKEGWYDDAFQYVINNGGIASERDYPYIADNGTCNSALGIFNGDDCLKIGSCGHNHVVLIVGYGSENCKDYWIVKNSWGQGGYIFIKRNTGTAQGVCNINCSGAYPIKLSKTTSKLASSM